ncbi:MAG: hypothetical protein RLZZ531_1035 [Bacteroidota bacterium]|jgi:hypothetical protein
MKLINLITVFSFLLISQVSAQTFTPGYYIINSSAEYCVAIPGGKDFFEYNTGCLQQYETEDLFMNSGEIVIAFEFSKGKYYCFDPNGRMLVIQGENCLTIAPMTQGAGVGLMLTTISLIDGSELAEGSYFWIMGQNIANSTVKIQIADGQTLDIPQDKIMFYGAYIKNVMKEQFYKKVE